MQVEIRARNCFFWLNLINNVRKSCWHLTGTVRILHARIKTVWIKHRIRLGSPEICWFVGSFVVVVVAEKMRTSWWHAMTDRPSFFKNLMIWRRQRPSHFVSSFRRSRARNDQTDYQRDNLRNVKMNRFSSFLLQIQQINFEALFFPSFWKNIDGRPEEFVTVFHKILMTIKVQI